MSIWADTKIRELEDAVRLLTERVKDLEFKITFAATQTAPPTLPQGMHSTQRKARFPDQGM